MPNVKLQMRAGRLVVWLVPLVFVLASWWAAAGFPYYLDNNETFLSYVHARNLEIWNPAEYGWLTAEATDPMRATTEDIYTHNPNGPRYLHYLLLLVGLRELPTQLLVLALAGTTLTAWMLARTFGQPGLLVVALAVVLDYVGFLSWTVNTYRVWIFAVFFGLVLAVAGRRAVWAGVLTFVLFQIEYGTALFVGVTVTVLAMLLHGWGARWLILASAAGAILSLTLFAAQVLAFYGPDGFLAELATTYARRGTAGAESGPERFIFQAWHGLYALAMTIARDTYNRPVLLLTVAGIGFSILMLRRPDTTPSERFVAALSVSGVLGALTTSTLLYGYFMGGFVESLLPLTVFLIAPALGAAALEIRRLLSFRFLTPHLGTISGALVLVPMVVSSVMHFEPPVAVPLFQMLQSDLRGRAVLAPFLGPALAGPELAFALGGGRAAATTDIDATPADLERLASMSDPDGTLTYVCLDTLYLRQRTKLGAYSVCEIAEQRLTARGHPAVASGLGWTVIRLDSDERAVAPPEIGAAAIERQP